VAAERVKERPLIGSVWRYHPTRFEATLEDVSRADAPAEVIARVRIEHPGQSSIRSKSTLRPFAHQSFPPYAVRAVSWWMRNLLHHWPALSVFTAGAEPLRLRCCCGGWAPPLGTMKCGKRRQIKPPPLWDRNGVAGKHLLEADPPRETTIRWLRKTGTSFCS